MGIFSKYFETYNEFSISKSKVIGNYHAFENLSQKSIIPVLKSNAYGFGLLEIGKIFQGVDNCKMIAVDGYFEALKLSRVFHKDILIMGAILIENYRNLNNKYHYVVGDMYVLEAISKCKKNFTIHLEVDTGMNRHGFKIANEKELQKILQILKSSRNINLVGIMTHLYDVNNEEKSKLQFNKFREITEKFLENNFKLDFIHISATGGAFYHDNFSTHARIGVGIYGINPFNEGFKYFDTFNNLATPIGEVTSRVNHIIRVKKGEDVGYGSNFTSKTDTSVAVIPFGYYEGLQRMFSNKVKFRIKNKEYEIAGNVCMNICMINIENDDIRVGEKVTVFSTSRKDTNSYFMISKQFGISEYELAVKISDCIRRKVIE